MNLLQEPNHDFFESLGLVPLTNFSKELVLSRANPLLRHRITMLSEAGTTTWIRCLTWDSLAAEQLERLFVKAQRFSSQDILGYGRLDEETYLSYIKVTVHLSLAPELDSVSESESETVYVTLGLAVEDCGQSLTWRLHEVGTAEPPSIGNATFLAGITDVHEELQSRPKSDFRTITSDNESLLSDTEYWNQYDVDSGTKSRSTSSIGVTSEEHYDRYDKPDLTTESDKISGSTTTMFAPVVDVIRHIKDSFRTLKELADAAGITHDQFVTVFREATDR